MNKVSVLTNPTVSPTLRPSMRPVVAPGVERLEPRVLMSMSYANSWIGNTWGGPNGKAMQNYLSDIYVAGDGTVYTDSTWDENHNSTGIYKNGNLVGRLSPDDGPDNAGAQAGNSVTSDGTYVYATFTNGDLLRRFKMDGTPAPFTGSLGDGHAIAVTLATGGSLDSVTVDAANHRLFISLGGENHVKVYDTQNLTGTPASFSVTRPGEMATDATGNLWVISKKSGSTGGQILHFTPAGVQLSDSITDTSSGARFDPTDVAFKSGKLYVADNGPDQQVKIYSTLAGNRTAPDSTFGVKGGIFSGSLDQIGKPGLQRFRGLAGVGVDDSGNIYVAQDTISPSFNFQHQGGHLESYKLADGTRNWELVSLEFVDGAAFDASSETANTVDVYTKYNRYTLDLSKTAPGSEWTWVGQTVNPLTHPTDYRATYTDFLGGQPTASYFQTINGKKFLFCTTMNAYNFMVYRFGNEGQVAIPSVAITYDHIWRDANSNGIADSGETLNGPGAATQNGLTGYSVDSAGDLWETYPNGNSGSSGVRQFKLQGLDSVGNPIWDFSHVTATPEPGPMSELYRNVYFPTKTGDPLSDSQFLAGYATGIDPTHHYGGANYNSKAIGSVIARYNNWSTGNRTAAWSIILPDYNRAPSSMAVAGDFIFVAYDGGAYQPDDGFVYIFRAADGGFVGKMQNSTPNWNGRVDIEYGISAYKRSNGEYLITVENDHHAAMALYRWTPPGSAPVAPAVTSIAGNTYNNLTWADDASAGSYNVLRSTSSNGTYATVAGHMSGTSYNDMGLTDGTSYYYKVVACGAKGDATSPIAAVVPRGTLPLKINVGGGAVSPDWIGDAYASGGITGSGQVVNSTGVVNAAPAGVMTAYRRSDSAFSYTIAGLPVGTIYTARLHFSENYFQSSGQRLFNITINGTQVLTGFDLYATAGYAKEIVRDFPATVDPAGKVTITLTPTKDWAKIDALELIPPAPALTSKQITDGNAQRSMIKDITYTFSSAVTLTSSAFTLTRRSDGLSVPVSAVNANPDGLSYLLSFGGTSIIGGSLPDGVYDLVLHAANVRDGFGQSLGGGDQTYTFHRLFGDANGDGIVDNLDLFQFRNSLNVPSSYLMYFDFNGDSHVDNLDLFAYRSRVGTRFTY